MLVCDRCQKNNKNEAIVPVLITFDGITFTGFDVDLCIKCKECLKTYFILWMNPSAVSQG